MRIELFCPLGCPPMGTPADKLRRARIARGFASAAEAARHYGWKEVTYTSHENGIRGLRIAIARVYAKAFGVPLGELIGAAVEDATPSGVGIRVIGEAAVGVWRDPSLSQTSDKTITVPDDHPISRFALKIVDQSINKVIGQGEYAVCEPVDVTEIEPGFFIAFKREQLGTEEISVRRISAVNGSTLRTTGHSTDSRFGVITDIDLEKGATVMGRVVGKYADIVF
jgi:hypothetical protein